MRETLIFGRNLWRLCRQIILTLTEREVWHDNLPPRPGCVRNCFVSPTKLGAVLTGETLTSAYKEASDVTALTEGQFVVIRYDLTNQMSCA